MFALAGCGPSFLETEDFGGAPDFKLDEDSQIVETDDNVAVMETVMTYQRAMQDRDVDTLRKLIASDYYENASSTDTTTDDYGNEALEDIFLALQESVPEVRFRVEVKRMVREGAFVHVDFAYESSFRYKHGDREKWKSRSDVNRLSLIQEKGDWKIISGM